jgi:hypothetical protein
MRHPGEALDEVRKSAYARLSGQPRRFIKGQECGTGTREVRSQVSSTGNSTLAGTLPSPAMLVDVPALVSACFTLCSS